MKGITKPLASKGKAQVGELTPVASTSLSLVLSFEHKKVRIGRTDPNKLHNMQRKGSVMADLVFDVDTSPASARVKGIYPGYVKRDNERTNEPLIDVGTGKRIYWLSLTLFPQASVGGEDVTVFAKCPSDAMPLILNDGEEPLVELLGTKVHLSSRGYNLHVEGLKRVQEPKASGK